MNISGNMGQILFYRARVNEFGDQTIVGNTQDIDAQTYRYGRWGNWRGYEGSTVALNPISNETYYSGGGGGTIEGTSWGDSWIEGIGKADVATGNWYLWRGSRNIGTEGNYRDLGVVKDIGRSVQPLTINTANPNPNPNPLLFRVAIVCSIWGKSSISALCFIKFLTHTSSNSFGFSAP